MFYKIIILFIFSTELLFANIQVFNRNTGMESEIKTLSESKKLYISAKDLAQSLSSKLYENKDRKKLVLYITGRRIKISGHTSFIIIDDQPFQMPQIVKVEPDDLYVPAEDFLYILKSTILPGLNFDLEKEFLDIDVVRFNITGIDIEEKANGTIIRLKTRKPFSERTISSFVNKHRWFYLTVAGALVDTVSINDGVTRGVVRQIESEQIGETAQVAFKLGAEIISHDWYQSLDPNEIIITLRTPLGQMKDRIEDVKDRWRLDTVVLDAGHGGKDGGTQGKYGTKEKDIVLDITKRIGRLLENNTKIKVVYTREEDVWLPLRRRTEIANENNGKLFISIHANANNNRTIQGFETYLLSPGKSEDAVAVASRENSVIQMEEKNNGYEKLSGEGLIMATMAQSMFVKESEDLASVIQMELDKQMDSPNRGVKQAGFYVLIGASMPNVLIEVGYLSNPTEEKKLKQPKYRQLIAGAIYESIKHFKYSREKLLTEE
tara:strand:+ start:353 stop:1828 length:1476 start_codon:yes stop_codon:yes gene_type:complete